MDGLAAGRTYHLRRAVTARSAAGGSGARVRTQPAAHYRTRASHHHSVQAKRENGIQRWRSTLAKRQETRARAGW